MTVEEAKKIGGKLSLISVGIGLLIAQLIMAILASEQGLLKGLLWFTQVGYKFNLVVGIAIILSLGYYFGRQAGYEILIKKRNCNWVGVKYGLIIVITTAFFSSWIGFFKEGIHLIGTSENPFYDYVYKPVFWITFFGLIPVIIVGLWFGKQIKKQEVK